MNAAPADRPGGQAADDVSDDGNSEPAGASQPDPQDNLGAAPGGDGRDHDEPPGEPDDDEYVPL